MKEIAVIGSGTMGNGIAHTFALHGFQVVLHDINQEAIDKGMATIQKNLDRQVSKEQITSTQASEALGGIKTSTSIEDLKNTDLVIEAATENKDIKFKIFRQLDEICKPSCILASNTSSISIGAIAAQTNRPDKVIGMHFMNPVPVMKLVEVIKGYKTSETVTTQILSLSESLHKTPVLVNDYPGFIANRILLPMINEAISALHEGVAGVKEIDQIMKLGMAHPMGPLQLADFIGLDVCLSILHVLHQGLGKDKYFPCPLLQNMVTAGDLGRKSKRGFYDYSQAGKNLIVAKNFA